MVRILGKTRNQSRYFGRNSGFLEVTPYFWCLKVIGEDSLGVATNEVAS
jgi:hypothetical protein